MILVYQEPVDLDVRTSEDLSVKRSRELNQTGCAALFFPLTLTGRGR